MGDIFESWWRDQYNEKLPVFVAKPLKWLWSDPAGCCRYYSIPEKGTRASASSSSLVLWQSQGNHKCGTITRIREGHEKAADVAALLEEGLVGGIVPQQVQQQTQAVLNHDSTVCPTYIKIEQTLLFASDVLSSFFCKCTVLEFQNNLRGLGTE